MARETASSLPHPEEKDGEGEPEKKEPMSLDRFDRAIDIKQTTKFLLSAVSNCNPR